MTSSSTSCSKDQEIQELGSWSQILSSLNANGSATDTLLEIFGISPSSQLSASSTPPLVRSAREGDVNSEVERTVEKNGSSRRCKTKMQEEVCIETRKKISNGRRKAHSAELHKVAERKRRDKIRVKLRTLQQLIPNSSSKSDRASVLDDAAKYLRALKLQAETMMSRSYSVPFTSPTAIQQPQFPAVSLFLPLGLGVCYPAASRGAALPAAAAQTQLSSISPQPLHLPHGGNSTWSAPGSSIFHQQASTQYSAFLETFRQRHRSPQGPGNMLC